MSKYKKKRAGISNRPKGWSKSNFGTVKFYRKDNWVISYYNHITYCVIDESYNYSCYSTRNKQEFLKEKRKLAYKNSLVWKALHGEYKKET